MENRLSIYSDPEGRSSFLCWSALFVICDVTRNKKIKLYKLNNDSQAWESWRANE